jgi:hypothetical protein
MNVSSNEPLIVLNTTDDWRFANNVRERFDFVSCTIYSRYFALPNHLSAYGAGIK